jgi:thiol-disulfide isomerase/thioredoxin
MYNLKFKRYIYLIISIFLGYFLPLYSFNKKLSFDIKNRKEFQNIIDNITKPAIINFYAPWNKDSITFNKTFDRISKIYSNKINFIKVDVTNNDLIPIVDTFGIYELPTIFFKFIGNINYDDMSKLVNLLDSLNVKYKDSNNVNNKTLKIKNVKSKRV